MESETKNNFSVPIAIVIAGIVIAGAIYFGDSNPRENTNNQIVEEQASSLDKMRPISDDDHIRGNPNAKVVIVEYSDTECPFCVKFHVTMKTIMEEYGKTGEVAWVYRHFPLYKPDSQGRALHPKAKKEAEALECASEIGGNDKFWEYTDRLYSITPANNGLDLAELPKIAEYVGLDVAKFNTCLSSDKFGDKVDKDFDNAQATGGQGTPWSIIVTKDGEKIPLNGAYPYESVKQIIDSLLSK